MYSSRKKSAARGSPVFPASVTAEYERTDSNSWFYSEPSGEPSEATQLTSDVSACTKGFSTCSFDDHDLGLFVIFPFLESQKNSIFKGSSKTNLVTINCMKLGAETGFWNLLSELKLHLT